MLRASWTAATARLSYIHICDSLWLARLIWARASIRGKKTCVIYPPTICTIAEFPRAQGEYNVVNVHQHRAFGRFWRQIFQLPAAWRFIGFLDESHLFLSLSCAFAWFFLYLSHCANSQRFSFSADDAPAYFCCC